MTVRSVVRSIVRSVPGSVVSSEGPTELVVNGDFASDTGWTLGTGWSIAGGVAKSDGSGSATDYIGRALVSTIGAGTTIHWRVTLTNEGAAPESAAGILLAVAEDAAGTNKTDVADLTGMAAGVHEGDFMVASPATHVVFSYRNAACGIDNLSIAA